MSDSTGVPAPKPGISVRKSMVAVACIGLGLGTLHGFYDFCFATHFAPGFDDSQFHQLRIGMTVRDVETIMGPPLLKDSRSPRWPGRDNWMYSEPALLTDDEDRRWVMFEDCVVVWIESNYVFE